MTVSIQKSMGNPPGGQWLEYWRPARRRSLRMFCFPHAGGNAAMYRDWHKVLPPSVEVCPVQYPGRGTRFREPLFTDLIALTEAAINGLRSLIDGPFVFFGHSMGALVAFEMARRLETRMGVSPGLLVIAGAQAPHLRVARRTHDLPDQEFHAEIRKINGTPSEILADQEAMQVLMPIVRADFRAVQTYQLHSGPRLRCPIAIFGGREDPGITAEHLDGWGEYTTGPFTSTLVNGTHFFVNEPESQLLQRLSQLLHPFVPA